MNWKRFWKRRVVNIRGTKQLFDNKFISQDEYDSTCMRCENRKRIFIPHNNLERDGKPTKTACTMNRAELQSSLDQLQKEHEMYYVTSRSAGHLNSFPVSIKVTVYRQVSHWGW
jgi:hypothetical protein